MSKRSEDTEVLEQIRRKGCRWPHCRQEAKVTRVSALDASDGFSVPLCVEHAAEGDRLGYWEPYETEPREP